MNKKNKKTKKKYKINLIFKKKKQTSVLFLMVSEKESLWCYNKCCASWSCENFCDAFENIVCLYFGCAYCCVSDLQIPKKQGICCCAKKIKSAKENQRQLELQVNDNTYNL